MIETLLAFDDLDMYEKLREASLKGGKLKEGSVPKIGAGGQLRVDIELPEGAVMPEEKPFVRQCEVTVTTSNQVDFVNTLIRLLSEGAKLHANSLPNFRQRYQGVFECKLLLNKRQENSGLIRVSALDLAAFERGVDLKEEANKEMKAAIEHAKGRTDVRRDYTPEELKKMKLKELVVILAKWDAKSTNSKAKAAKSILALQEEYVNTDKN